VLVQRGLRVGTIKHHVHPGIDIDRPGKDSWRHTQAGSKHTVIVAADQVVSIRQVAGEPAVSEMAAAMRDVDIVLTEGFRWADTPKVEILRAARSQVPLCQPEELLALVTDLDLDLGVPRFALDDVAALANLIEAQFLTPTKREG
jgi:molybdopterin-guanine dinucleotide biosynthesis protein B